ncbi:MAG: hypothetical protein CMC67_04610 [Flavobacteriaceae bacterium]|jgi:surface polysaccharide O-acyltransferase-like enzyme|nr:hypothetical protein [Flavobacteriaceae bacterium]|tara:strand:+ start:291 stop:527 length:237 start_codon:yes stop_codon:yes gene_type:complete
MSKIKFLKGLKKMSLAIIFAFVGPFIIHQALQNKNHEFYIYVLILGLSIAGLSIAFGFIGISNLVDSLLNGQKNKTEY